MKNIKLELGSNSFREADPKIPRVSLTVDFEQNEVALKFMLALNKLIIEFGNEGKDVKEQG